MPPGWGFVYNCSIYHLEKRSTKVVTKHSIAEQQAWLGEVQIRAARREDLPALEWDGEYAAFRSIYARTYEQSLRDEGAVWVADLHGEIIGQVMLRFEVSYGGYRSGERSASLFAFRVKAPYRSAGLGTRLMELAEDDLRRRGIHRVTLNVAKSNTAAQRLYRRRGYREIGEDYGVSSYPDASGKPHLVDEPAWTMEKWLDFDEASEGL
jgi:ribosomal protein S18 acetylase RimI-like enzyme